MNRVKTRGFSIIAAIFLVVVVALLAAFLANIGAVQRTSSAFSVIASRAHFAALSGVEWSVHQVLSNPTAPDCFVSGSSFTVGGVGSGNFRVSLSCSEQEVFEGADTYSVFDIEVIAEFGNRGNEDYFRRVLSASVASDL